MKKQTWLTALLILFITTAFSQEDDSTKIKLDLLRAPSSPGANLLGFAVTDIEKPTDVSSFMASLQSAAGANSILPSNYAVDLAPFWLFRAKGLTTDKMNSTQFRDVFRQTFVVSAAVRGNDSTDGFNPRNFYNSFGLKFSIHRGQFSKKTRETLDSIFILDSSLASDVNLQMKQFQDTSKAYIELGDARRQRLIETGGNLQDPAYLAITQKMTEMIDGYKQQLLVSQVSIKSRLAMLKEKAKSFKIERFGFFIDFAGGVSLEYLDKAFNRSRVHNGGAWLTFGGNYECGLSVLGLARYLYNPDKVYADDAGIVKMQNVSTFDAGGRLVYNSPQSRFALSAEAIYRSVLQKNTIDPSWRLALNAEYDIGNNQRLTFVFGRAFDGTIKKDGTVIAALNFLKGFGNKR